MRPSPVYKIIKKGSKHVVLLDGREDARILPCLSEEEAKKQLARLLSRVKQ